MNYFFFFRKFGLVRRVQIDMICINLEEEIDSNSCTV